MITSIVRYPFLAWFGVGLYLPASYGEPLSKQLHAVIDNHSTAKRTTVTLKVVDLENGEVLFDRGGERLMTPASNLKIYTTACALDTFGPEHRFQSIIRVEGSLDEGVLTGNLVLEGGGDAMLTSDDLAQLADRTVKEWGLREIRGAVVIDDSRYASPLKGPGWMWDDDPDYYNMSITPLMVDFNVLRLRLLPSEEGLGGQLLVPSYYPPVIVLPVDSFDGNRLATRHPFTHPVLVAGKGELKEPEDKSPADDDSAEEPTPVEDPDVVRLTMHNPGNWVRGFFTAMLEARGVTFIGDGVAQEASTDSEALELQHQGRSLAETLAHFNKRSENSVGEVLLHEIAIAKGKQHPHWSDGAEAITQWLIDETGLEADSFRLVDGSGLSRYNLITADSSIRLLQFMHNHRYQDDFYASLKRYHVEVNGETQVRVAAKPGGMGSVSTISGYIDTVDGRRLAFSMLANGFKGPSDPFYELRRQVWQVLAKSRGE